MSGSEGVRDALRSSDRGRGVSVERGGVKDEGMAEHKKQEEEKRLRDGGATGKPERSREDLDREEPWKRE